MGALTGLWRKRTCTGLLILTRGLTTGPINLPAIRIPNLTRGEGAPALLFVTDGVVTPLLCENRSKFLLETLYFFVVILLILVVHAAFVASFVVVDTDIVDT